MYFIEARDRKSTVRRFGMFSDRTQANEWAQSHCDLESVGGKWVTWAIRHVEAASAIVERADEHYVDNRDFASLW